MLALVRRRLLLILLTAVAVALLAFVLAGLRPVTFSADSVLIVPAGSGGTGPGSANEALSLANTYAELIPRDGDVLLAVASVLQVPVSDVRQQLSVSPIGNTALLRVGYESSDQAQAVLGSRAAAESILFGTTTADTVPRGSVRLVSLADADAVTVSGGVSPSTVPIGFVLGLAVGAMLAVAAERANRRVDTPSQASFLLDVPVLDLDTASPARRDAMMRRWRDAGPANDVVVVAVTGVELDHARVARVCEALASGSGDEVVAAPDGLASPVVESAPAGTIVLVPTGAPGSGQPHESVAKVADLVVLLVPMSVRRAAVVETVAELLTFGRRSPSFVLTTGRVRPGRSAHSPTSVPRAPAEG